jgi:hypothetical protein
LKKVVVESEDEELITKEFNEKQMTLILEIKDLEEELRTLERQELVDQRDMGTAKTISFSLDSFPPVLLKVLIAFVGIFYIMILVFITVVAVDVFLSGSGGDEEECMLDEEGECIEGECELDEEGECLLDEEGNPIMVEVELDEDGNPIEAEEEEEERRL